MFRDITGRRRSVISYIKSPLGFYALALLIVEAFLLSAGKLFDLSETMRVAALATGVLLFAGVIAVVTVLVVKYPQALVFSEHSHLEWQSMQVFGDSLNPWPEGYVIPKAGTEPPSIPTNQIVSQDKNSTEAERER